MKLNREFQCDVLVLGSGIAGISAALRAAELGKRVTLCCKGKLFSGSSFYPGTWGLGLVGPENEQDQEDLAQTIQAVGCGMADSAMVKAFVSGITPAIDRVRKMGVRLRRANQGQQKEFIPCFDHKHRDWNGIEFDSAREVFSAELRRRNVRILPGYEALELVKNGESVCGAILYGDNALHYIGSGSVVLATGGYGCLFRYHLCTEDVAGMGQQLALAAGCSLVNMEFMQMMPGYITPAYKTIFNEKTFRFTRMHRPDGGALLSPEEEALLPLRSTHGPFTCRLASGQIDIALFRQFLADPRGVSVDYSPEMLADPPEFVRVYFDWLQESKHVSMEDTIQIGIFAHAANGGVRIFPDASTQVPGLFAAGEVTGGMHGADRIGGLSTANGLVFGTKAGESAAAYIGAPSPETREFRAVAAPGCTEALREMQQCMFENAMVLRSAQGLENAIERVSALRDQIRQAAVPSTDWGAVAQTRQFLSRCDTAESLLRAALLRGESRGSHYRTDCPRTDPRMNRKIYVSQDAAGIHADFEKEVLK